MNNDKKRVVENLKKYALSHGFDKFVFRNNRVNKSCGDFTIFLYDYNKDSTRYVVGFDGVWEKGWHMSFDNVINQIYEYVDRYENTCE